MANSSSNEWGGVEKLAQQRNDALAEVERLRGAFKNFHRLLCERFGYCHDENDWQRDQLSLIEHIAKRIAVETTDVTRMRNTLVQSGYTDCGGELWKPPLGRRPVFLDENLRLLDLVARMLPYVQQSDPADFADIEAATAIGREATEALATIRPEEPKRNQANSTSSGLLAATPTPRGNLPNSLGTGGAGSHPAASSSEKASPAQLVDALQDPVHVEIGSTRPIQAVREGYCEHGIPRQFCTAVHDVCKDCGVELVSGTCDKCGAVNGDA